MGFLARVDQSLPKAVVAVVIVATTVGYLVGRKSGRNTPGHQVLGQLAAPPPNTVPSNFDVIKELNTHVGRLATVLGFVFAATTFSIATGPVHDAISRIPVYVALSILGMSLGFTAITIVSALDSPLPEVLNDTLLWDQLIARKKTEINQVLTAILLSLVALMTAWFGSAPNEQLAWQFGFGEVFFLAGLAIGGVVLWARRQWRRPGRSESPRLRAPWWRRWLGAGV